MKQRSRWIIDGINSINRVPIVKKMVTGYLFLVVLPLLFFGVIMYNHLYNNILNTYTSGKQSLVNQAGTSFNVDLAQVNSIYSLFQYDPIVVDYLRGQYLTPSDQVYNYLKYIRPMFQFAHLGNPSIQSIKLYKKNLDILPVSGEIENLDSLHLSNKDSKKLNKLKNEQGMWIAKKHKNAKTPPYLFYYQKVYDETYSNEIAVLEVTFNQHIFNNLLKTVKGYKNVNVLIKAKNGDVLYRDKSFPLNTRQLTNRENVIDKSHDNYWIDNKKRLLINTLTMKTSNLEIFVVSPVNEVFKNIQEKTFVFGLLFLGLLGLLSVIYYATASVLTQRILGLARHMRHVDENQLTPYEGDKGKDEIGLLTESYNSLIYRIDELMNKVHRAELLKKEADYLVLQAQVNPHFLYNTLESIRMLAEMNEDEEVVEATYTLSKLLRYSLSVEGNSTTLEEELENIKDYLSIQQLRMGDKLNFQINKPVAITNFRCPRFILQPLVENCINHGLARIRKKGFITIDIKETDLHTMVKISDNGPGITEERLAVINGVLNNTLEKTNLRTQSSGLGLYNVSERIKAFFGADSGLEVKSRLNDGTSLILKIQK
ncbi:histidine kinase [Pullulanibacillus sp. KACC 23026]|uniref:sensor histidine kinase n=1 Tax=Pullulanibacillus sp. KACC 23026 TaxID=3028315 RepID=UPI0023AEB0A6|nr:histidine kinase [Pullulanibacillus sp. KACC 23026]WEG11741.1 histidine kinase [Pullulanibacillus sp. KACC 23026]